MMRRVLAILAMLTATAALALDPRAALLLADMPSADGLMAEYQVFDNADDSALLNHATLCNGATAHSRRLWFDGVNDYARTASNEAVNATTELTVMAWIFPTNLHNKRTGGDGQAVASRYDNAGNNRSWELLVSIKKSHPFQSGSVVVQFGEPYTGTYSGRAILCPGITYSGKLFPGVMNNDTWYHVAFTFESGTVLIYVNGVEYAPEVVRTIPTGLRTSSLPLTVGHSYRLEPGFLGGIGPVKIYRRVAKDEIMRDFLRGPPQ
jgi:hypothetical protein